MKFENKGMTLIELLVTIVFVGMILMLMFSLLNDLKSETDNNNFAYNNQVNKVDAIHTIEKDLNEFNLIGIESTSSSDLNIIFHYLKGNDGKDATLTFNTKNNKYYLNYTNVNGENHSWEMKGATIDPCASFIIYKESNAESNTNDYYFRLNIYLYNSTYSEFNNKDNNNIIDDIEITYSGYNNLVNNNDYLTNKANGTYYIGKCAQN